MSSIEKHTVPKLSKQQRLSDYAVGVFTAITSRKGIKKAIKKKWIMVNEEIGQSGDYLKGGEELILSIEEIDKPIFELKLQVLFEDDHLAIINKPAGITVSGNKFQTIENALPYNLSKSNQLDALDRPEAIHRLDHPTSGVLLIGKTRSAVQVLNQLFNSRTINKVYHAITYGQIENKGIIELPIDDKPSKTTFKLIDSEPSERFSQLNLVECQPYTGRRHQIRKHLAAVDAPILGDPLYFKEGLLLKGKGLYLHASSLEFMHPVTDEELKIECELPKKFKKVFRDSATPSWLYH